MFSKKGLMDKKQRKKMEFWKGRQKEDKEKNIIGITTGF